MKLFKKIDLLSISFFCFFFYSSFDYQSHSCWVFLFYSNKIFRRINNDLLFGFFLISIVTVSFLSCESSESSSILSTITSFWLVKLCFCSSWSLASIGELRILGTVSKSSFVIPYYPLSKPSPHKIEEILIISIFHFLNYFFEKDLSKHNLRKFKKVC